MSESSLFPPARSYNLRRKMIYLIVAGLLAGFTSYVWLWTAIFILFLFGDVGGGLLDVLLGSIPLVLATLTTALLCRALDVSWWRGSEHCAK